MLITSWLFLSHLQKVYCVISFEMDMCHAEIVFCAASLLGACETSLLERSVSREDFKENPVLPDWMSSDPQDWECLRTVPVRKAPPMTSSRRTLPSTTAVSGGSPRLLRAAQRSHTWGQTVSKFRIPQPRQWSCSFCMLFHFSEDQNSFSDRFNFSTIYRSW